MSAIEITAKETSTNTSATVSYDCGDTLDEMTAKFGADKVFELALGHTKIAAQAQIRKALKAGWDSDRIQSEISTWTPNSTLEIEGQSFTTDKIAARAAGSMSSAEIAELMSKLQETLAAKMAEGGEAAGAGEAPTGRRG